jgi:hypothetical protein
MSKDTSMGIDKASPGFSEAWCSLMNDIINSQKREKPKQADLMGPLYSRHIFSQFSEEKS